MKQSNRRLWLACLALAGCVAGLASWGTGRAADPTPKAINIGMVGTLFRDVPDSLIDTMGKPFGMLMFSQTGMTGHLMKTGDANDLGKKLAEGEVHVGIFHGFEFAWVREKYTKLKPLVIAVNQS